LKNTDVFQKYRDLGYSPKFTFFKNKNKIKAGNAEKADQERLQK